MYYPTKKIRPFSGNISTFSIIFMCSIIFFVSAITFWPINHCLNTVFLFIYNGNGKMSDKANLTLNTNAGKQIWYVNHRPFQIFFAKIQYINSFFYIFCYVISKANFSITSKLRFKAQNKKFRLTVDFNRKILI